LFFQLTPDYLADPSHCPVETGARRLLQGDGPAFSGNDFLTHATSWLTVSVIASLLLGGAFVHLIRHHAHTLTKATIGFQLFVPTLLCFSLLFSGHVWQAVGAGLLAGLTYFVFYLWRNELAVAAKLLSVAGHGLAENFASLVALTIGLNVASLVLAAPLVGSLIVSLANGDVVPNPMRQGSDVCVDASGLDVPCCAWQPRASAAASMALAGLTAVWLSLTANQIRVFAVSGTIAQWYFSPPGALTVGSLRRSLRHGLTSSFGTNAFAGLVLTFTNAVKSQNAADQQNGNYSLLGLLASCIASIYEYLTKFATVMAAISGEGLLPAGRRVTDLLARNLLNAFATTIWFPSAVVHLASFTLATLWGGAVWVTYRWLHGSRGASGGELYPSSNAAVLGVLAGAFSLFVLVFVCGVLLSVLDAVFVCFALDRDREAVANAEMYEALLGVAEERGVLVQGPNDTLEYGAVDSGSGYAPPVMRR
jgi:hypothetical protein